MELLAKGLALLPDLLAIAMALLTVASLVTALTPSPKDDAIVDKIRRVLAWLSALQPRDSAGRMKLPATKPAEPPPLLRERPESDSGRRSAR